MRILTEKQYKSLVHKVHEGVAYEQRCEYLEKELALAELKVEEQENKIFLLQQTVTLAEKFKSTLKRFLED